MSVPCPESGNRAARHPELVFTCVHNGLQFSLAIGAGPTQKGFEDNLAAAQRDNGEIETEITALGSRRAFTSFSHPDRPVVRVLVVDYTPNEMILAIVAEQPEGGISPSDRPAAMELAKRFIATLEVPAK